MIVKQTFYLIPSELVKELLVLGDRVGFQMPKDKREKNGSSQVLYETFVFDGFYCHGYYELIKYLVEAKKVSSIDLNLSME